MIIKDIFLKWILNIQKDYTTYIVIYHSYQKEWKLINVRNSFVIYPTRKIRHTRKFTEISVKSWIKVKKKIHRVIEFNQKEWLKPYIHMNTDLRKAAKNDFEKDLFKLMNNSVFGKTMENIRKHRDIKLVTTDKKRSKLVSEPNYHTINLISEDLSITEMKKTKVKVNKPI